MEYKLPLLVNKLVPNAYLPTKGSPGAAGYDLYSIEECIIPAHGKYVVKTGISLSIPSGNYGRIGIPVCELPLSNDFLSSTIRISSQKFH